MKHANAFALALLLATGAHATTLRELLDAAEKNNLDRQISIEQRMKAATELKLAYASLFPSLTVQGSWTHSQYPVEIAIAPGAPTLVITPENQFDGIFRLELPIIDTQRWFRAGAASAAAESAEHRDALVRENVLLQTATTYYSFAAALAFRESAKKSLGVAEAQLRLTEIRAGAGAVTEFDLLRARAEVQRNKQTIADSVAMVANMRRALRTLTGIELAEDAALPADDLAREGELEQLEARVGETPMLKAAASDVRAAESLAKAAKFSLVPQITANFTERITNATGFAGRANAYTAGLGLVWRLDGTTYFNISAQGAQARIAGLGAERQRLAARDRVHSDWQRVTAAMQKVGAAKAQVESAERAAEMARTRYEVGAATQVDVIQAERDLFSSEVGLIQARTELASSHVSLRISSGLPLDL